MSTIDKSTAELYRCFNRFNKQYFNNELPIPAITIQSKGKRNAMGWCSNAPRWEGENVERYEINISAEYLNIDIMETMDTLLHEMVHLHNRTSDPVIKDVSRGGGYHNKRFKEACERMNMFQWNHEKPDPKIGFSDMKLTEETKTFIRDMIAPKEEAFAIYRKAEMALKGGKKGNSYKHVCPVCDAKVRASKPGLRIMCMECDEQMEEEA